MKPARIFRFGFTFIAMLGMLFGTLVATVSAGAVTYSGQGTYTDELGIHLNTEICGIANGAPVDGPYLLWVLTAGGKTGSTAATIYGPWGSASMSQSGGGAFKYVSDWYDLDSLVGTVYADFNNSPNNPQLVISHGCAPEIPVINLGCSPGFFTNKNGEGYLAPYYNMLMTDAGFVGTDGYTFGYAINTPNDTPSNIRQAAAAYINALYIPSGFFAFTPEEVVATFNADPSFDFEPYNHGAMNPDGPCYLEPDFDPTLYQ